MLRSTIILLALTLLPGSPARAWGAVGHRMLATAALKDLPPDLAGWFAGHEATLPDHANDPDHWKEHDRLEGPRHFLDSEYYGGAARVPLAEGDARRMLGAATFQVAGQVPWTIQDREGQLVQAFAGGDPAAVALAASILSHYVGDLSVPLHTTVNYNGQVTHQPGIHARWESGLLERIVAAEGWVPDVRPAVLGTDPMDEPWAWLQGSFDLVPGVLADDMTAEQADGPASAAGPARVPPDFGPDYWTTFLQLQEPHVKEQLDLAAQRTAGMILMAWTQAGSPAAPPAQSSR